MELFTTSNVMFVIGLIGIIFTVFKAFYDPQKKFETNDLLIEQKSNFLADAYDKKFADVQTNIDNLNTINQNHLHTLDIKIDNLSVQVSSICKDIIKLETIINERIPRKII